MPPCFAVCVIVRVRTCTPAPHDLLHTLQSCTVKAQSSGHAWVLHDVTCSSVPTQGLPPFVCCVLTLRERVLEPVPHEWLQTPHAEYAFHTQSLGHACPLHMRESTISGHMVPPSEAATIVVRLRIWRPPPQDAEHACHSPYALTTQSTGHVGPLQLREPTRLGQALPPYAAALLTTRARTCVPPTPHETEHLLHALYPDTVQSNGHGCALQLSLSIRFGHSRPRLLAAVKTERVRSLEPPPQLLVQAVQRVHSETSQ